MARGKHATQAANGRAETLAAEVEALKSQLASARAEHQRERANLKAEVQQLANRLAHDVDAMSEGRVRQVNEAMEVSLREERNDCHNRLVSAFRLFLRLASQQPPDIYAALAARMGLDKDDIWGAGEITASRDIRRLPESKIARALAIARSAGAVDYSEPSMNTRLPAGLPGPSTWDGV